MVKKIDRPFLVEAAGNPPKIIREYFGRVNSADEDLSLALMKSPGGWLEPGQTPEFDEYSLVLKGTLRVRTRSEVLDIQAGQAVLVCAGEWVQYSTPGAAGAEYIAVCRPAFSSKTVHRDDQADSKNEL